MKIKSVKRTKSPSYPILDYYIYHPELLSKNIPESWLKNKYVATSLATFVMFGMPKVSVCANSNRIEMIDTIGSDKKKPINDNIKDSVKIAPIFAHGEGSGATGCMVMSPPVFISEDEARKIIFDKLAEEGFVVDTIKTNTVKFKSKQIACSCISNEELNKYPEVDVKIKMDGYESKLKLAIEYVSVDDYFKFAEEKNLWTCTATAYRTKDAAEIIREKLIEDNKTNAVVFYDPIASVDYQYANNWEKSESEAKEESKKMLLAQVEDFINWFRKENILEK